VSYCFILLVIRVQEWDLSPDLSYYVGISGFQLACIFSPARPAVVINLLNSQITDVVASCYRHCKSGVKMVMIKTDNQRTWLHVVLSAFVWQIRNIGLSWVSHEEPIAPLKFDTSIDKMYRLFYISWLTKAAKFCHFVWCVMYVQNVCVCVEYTVVCDGCKAVSNTYEAFLDISLEVKVSIQ